MRLHPSHQEPMQRTIFVIVLLVVGAVLTIPFSVLSSARGIAGYLPLHMLFETFAIFMSLLIFVVGWHAHDRKLSGNIVLLACVFLGVGLLNFAHMLSFVGMPDFVTPSGPEKAIYFWLAERSLAALALLAVALLPWRPFASTATRYKLLAAVLAMTAFVYWLVLFHQEKLPHTFIPGQGLTAVKIAWEYAIIALNLAAAFALWVGEGIFVLNDAGVPLFMNPEAERLLGWAAVELRGKDMHLLIHAQKPDGTPLPEFGCGILGVLRDGNAHRASDDVFVRKDGSLMPVSFVASPIARDGKVAAVVVAFQDISQRKRAERSLLESREQLRELSAHLQTVREEERTRIARELHDELGQMLTGVKLDAKWLGNRLSGAQPEVTGKIGAMTQLIDGTLDAMRRVAADLRPTMLDDLGLVAAVEWLAEDFGERTGISTRLEIDVGEGLHDELGEECELDAEVSTAAFRIVQECLTNAARHAHAEQVLVLLECHNGKLVLMVSDNGKGISRAGKGKSRSLGIVGMRERVYGVGGKFYLFSIPGEGTTVLSIIPIRMANHAEEAQ